MNEAIYISISGISLAALLGVCNAWIDRKSGRWTRQALARRLALRCMSYAAGLDARENAVAEAMKRNVELV